MITIKETRTQKLGRCYDRHHYVATSPIHFYQEEPKYSWDTPESIKRRKDAVLEAMRTFCGCGNGGNGSIKKQVQLEDGTWELHYSYEVDSGD